MCFSGRYNKYSRVLSQSPWIIDGERMTENSVEVETVLFYFETYSIDILVHHFQYEVAIRTAWNCTWSFIWKFIVESDSEYSFQFSCQFYFN
jgi:hypothetical protein